MVGITAAHAEAPYFYAERGHWTVMAGGSACRALNRPPEDFNASPYNALMIVARPDNTMGVDVFFWPGAFDAAGSYDLLLTFDAGKAMALKSRPTIGDYMLTSDTDVALWRAFQSAARLYVGVKGEPTRSLHFGLDGVDWVLTTLQSCISRLPKT